MPLIAEFDQRIVADIRDVVRAHALEHFTEQIELLVGFRGVGGRRADVLAQREHHYRRGHRRDQTQTLHRCILSWQALRAAGNDPSAA